MCLVYLKNNHCTYKKLDTIYIFRHTLLTLQPWCTCLSILLSPLRWWHHHLGFLIFFTPDMKVDCVSVSSSFTLTLITHFLFDTLGVIGRCFSNCTGFEKKPRTINSSFSSRQIETLSVLILVDSIWPLCMVADMDYLNIHRDKYNEEFYCHHCN